MFRNDNEEERTYLYNYSNNNHNSKIEETEDWELNDDFTLDLDEDNRILGIEFYGDIINYLEKIEDTNNYHVFEGKYTWGLKSNLSDYHKVSAYGLAFFFREVNFKEFVGYFIEDTKKYNIKL